MRPTPELERGSCRFLRVTLPRRCATRNMQHASRRLHAFTLIELMVVVGIMGLIMAIGVPIAYKISHRSPMSQAVVDVTEVCRYARRQAILQARQVDLMIYPRENRLAVTAAAIPAPSRSPEIQVHSQEKPAGPDPALTVGTSGSARLPEKVIIELLDINKLGHEFRDDDYARVRFFPNGTCDELAMVLLGEGGERREITLEVTTGQPDVESDVRKFH
jgi:prepilin-type N-terminal cleavage/methylation domain-containing protein